LSCRVNARHAPHPYRWLHKHLQRQVIATLSATTTTPPSTRSPAFNSAQRTVELFDAQMLAKAAIARQPDSPAARQLGGLAFSFPFPFILLQNIAA